MKQMNNIYLFAFIQANEKSKKAFLVFLVLFIFILLIFGAIYALIAKHMNKNAKVIDTYMVELCQYKIVNNPDQFFKAVKYYEKRKIHKAIKWPMRILIMMGLFLLIYCLVSKDGTTKKVFSDFFDLFPRFKWQTVKSVNEELKAVGSSARVVGISWMPVSLIPQVYWNKINPKDINLYISCIFYIVLIVLFVKISLDALSYTARIIRGKEKSRTVFEQNLDEYNYFNSNEPYLKPVVNNNVNTQNQVITPQVNEQPNNQINNDMNQVNDSNNNNQF